MLLRFRTLVLAAALLLAMGLGASAATVADVAGQVSQTYYTHVLDDLLFTHTGSNRGGGTPTNVAAAANILSQFQSFGLQTSYDPFLNGGTSYNNVVGVLPGKIRPNDIYVVGGHFDSANNPGADDNASGTAGVIEAARVLSQYSFEATIVFVGFNLEEWGLIGSNAYATEHAADNILGAISLDMIAYNPVGAIHNTALIYGRTTSDPIKIALQSAVSTYGGITSTLQGQLDASDHAPFEWQGKQACLLIEGGVWSNPYYHQATDNVDMANYIDYAYATSMTRGTVGYLATAAGLMDPPVTIGSTRGIPDGTEVWFGNAIVVAEKALVGDGFYAEAPDRSSGVRVIWSDTVPVGAAVSVVGTKQTIGHETVVQAQTVYVQSTGNALPRPLGASASRLLTKPDSVGRNMRIWGAIGAKDTADPPTWFVLNDPSGVPVKCKLAAGVTFDPIWTLVSVTGAASVEDVSGQAGPVILVRSSGDIKKIN